jgi:hypothetical protein
MTHTPPGARRTENAAFANAAAIAAVRSSAGVQCTAARTALVGRFVACWGAAEPMGLTRRATCMEELLEACGDPEGMLNSIQHARVYRQGLSTAGESFIDGSEEEEDDGSISETGSESSSSSSGSASSSSSEGDEQAAADDNPRSAGNGKRYEGTDEDRAERLARMMAAQCTMEAPEKVGLRTGWKPSSSGFGVVPDGTMSGNLGLWTPQLCGTSADASSTSTIPAAPVSSTSSPVGIARPAGGFQFAFACPGSSQAADSKDETNVGAIILAAQRAYVAVSLACSCVCLVVLLLLVSVLSYPTNNSAASFRWWRQPAV